MELRLARKLIGLNFSSFYNTICYNLPIIVINFVTILHSSFASYFLVCFFCLVFRFLFIFALYFSPMGYENDLGIFSPDGRLIQVEYAQHASSQGGIVTLQANDSKIMIAYEDQHINPLLIHQGKIHCIDKDLGIFMIFSGLKPDSFIVRNAAKLECRRWKFSTSKDITIDVLARAISKFKQKYTVDSRYRPLGICSVLFSCSSGGKIYVIEPDGNYSEYQRCSVGYKSEQAMEYLAGNDETDAFMRALDEVAQGDTKSRHFYVLEGTELTECNEYEIKERIKQK